MIYVELARKSVRTLSVDSRKIDSLRATSHRARDFRQGHVKNQSSCLPMDVATGLESLHKSRIPREVCKQAQLDLRIIRGQQQPTLTRNESPPDIPAQFSPNRNVLQIGVTGGEPARTSYRLIERGVQSAT